MGRSVLPEASYTPESIGRVLTPPKIINGVFTSPAGLLLDIEPLQSLLEMQEGLRTGRVDDDLFIASDNLKQFQNASDETVNAAIDIQLLAAGICSLLSYNSLGSFEHIWSLRTSRGGRSRKGLHIDTLPTEADALQFPAKITCAVPGTRVLAKDFAATMPEEEHQYQPSNLDRVQARHIVDVPAGVPVLFSRSSVHDSPLDTNAPSVFAEILLKRV